MLAGPVLFFGLLAGACALAAPGRAANPPAGFRGGGFRPGSAHFGGSRLGGFRLGSFRLGGFRFRSFAGYRSRYGFRRASYWSYPFFTYYPYLPSVSPYVILYPYYPGYYGEVQSEEEPGGAPARIAVTAAAGAVVWFDGHRTSATGPVRKFRTPPLRPGREYGYEVRARWNEDDRQITQTQQITVTAGAFVEVRFPVTEK
jgi:uncharacterized protein (TIGR03000 family)